MSNYIAALPAGLRHFILGAVSILGGDLLNVLVEHQTELVQNVDGPFQGVATLAIGALTAYYTPLVQAYGKGQAVPVVSPDTIPPVSA